MPMQHAEQRRLLCGLIMIKRNLDIAIQKIREVSSKIVNHRTYTGSCIVTMTKQDEQEIDDKMRSDDYG